MRFFFSKGGVSGESLDVQWTSRGKEVMMSARDILDKRKEDVVVWSST